MRSTIGMLVAVMILVEAMPATARTVNTSASITATQVSEDDSGPCVMPGFAYDGLCPSGTCICRKFSGTIRGGLIGKGPVNISLTIDTGAVTSTPGCTPFFGAATGTTQRVSQSVNTVGVICPSMQRNKKNPVSGGAGIIPAGQSGWGTLNGTLDEGRVPAPLKIRLKARVTF